MKPSFSYISQIKADSINQEDIMTTTITVAGATGNLGKRTVKALLARGANVVALARTGTSDEKIKELEGLGAKVAVVNMTDVAAMSAAMVGAACVVSILQGLHDVIVETQSVLLDAAVAAGVPRFIPSDFSTDFTNLTPGENRNFDLRREFHKKLDAAPIALTSIFNGAFAEILTYNVPLLDFQKKTVGYWEDADYFIDFTTMDDTAAFTAAAAMDAAAPRALRIASFQVSAKDLVEFTGKTFPAPFELVRLGDVEDLRAHNKAARAAHPEGEQDLYSDWQQGQYMQSMFSSHHASLDNDRYPGLTWTKLEQAVQPRG